MQRTVDEYVVATAFARPLVDRIAYCVRVLHANRPHFEECMGFEITDYHTKVSVTLFAVPQFVSFCVADAYMAHGLLRYELLPASM